MYGSYLNDDVSVCVACCYFHAVDLCTEADLFVALRLVRVCYYLFILFNGKNCITIGYVITFLQTKFYKTNKSTYANVYIIDDKFNQGSMWRRFNQKQVPIGDVHQILVLYPDC